MNIKKIVNNILNESLDLRAKSITKKIIQESSKGVCEQCGSQLYEGECTECGSMKEEFYEEDSSSACETYKYHLKHFGEDDDRTIRFKDQCESSDKSSEDELDEELKGGQHKLDVAEPKGKLTSADFKKLRSRKHNKKSKDIEEEFFYSDEEDAERLSKQQPTYVGRGLKDNKIKADLKNKMYGSFSDVHGWYDDSDREFRGEFEDDYDEETFDDFKTFNKKYAGKQRWFSPGKQGEQFFNKYKEQYGSPFRVRKYKSVDSEQIGQELDEYSAADEPTQWDEHEWESRLQAGRDEAEWRKKQKMEYDKEKEKNASFFDKMKRKIGFGKTETDEGNAFTGALAKTKKGEKFKLGNKTYTDRSNLDESVDSKLRLTESDLIDLIESIVLEEKEKKVLDRKKAKGYTEYEKNVKLSKKENDEYIKSVTKKLKDYLKGGSKDDFSFEPKHFPKGNGQLEKMKKKAYTPSEAVEEYIEEFAYSPGMENLQYDEVKPNDEWIEMNLEGSSKTGNSSDYANAEKTELGKKINEKRKKNLYGIEKRKNSYKRVKQPIDSAGEGSGEKSIKSMFKKLEESAPSKEEKLLNEELSKMSDLIKYNTNTQ